LEDWYVDVWSLWSLGKTIFLVMFASFDKELNTREKELYSVAQKMSWTLLFQR